MTEMSPLEAEIARRTARGWEIVSRAADEAQMRRRKHFSFVWAFLWFLVFGLGLIVYLLWHWAKRDRYAYLRAEGGRLVVAESRGLLATVFAPLGAYFNWAASREQTWAKTLALGAPVAAVVVLIVIIAAAAAGGGGDNEPQAVAGTEGSPSVGPGATPAPEETETPRIVQAMPGAIAEAEDVRVSLLEVIDPWTEYGAFEAPQAGTRYVAIRVRLENVGGSGHDLYSANFNLQTSGLEGEVTFLKAEPDLFAAGPFLTLAAAGTAEGWVTFVVPEAAELTTLKYDPNLFTTDDIEFQFQ